MDFTISAENKATAENGISLSAENENQNETASKKAVQAITSVHSDAVPLDQRS